MERFAQFWGYQNGQEHGRGFNLDVYFLYIVLVCGGTFCTVNAMLGG